jgi:hypothetical protein
MNIKFQLIEYKQDSNGLCPVFLRYFYSGSDLRYFTGEKCKLTDWDSDKMKFKRSHDGWQHANERLSKLRSDLESAAHNFKLQRIIPTPQQLKDCIAPQSVKKEIVISLSLIDVYDDFYKYSENEGKKLSTLKSLKTTRNHLAQFCATNPTLVNNFTDGVYNAFIAWMVSNFEYQPNSLGLHTKNLNTFFHWCEKVRRIQLSHEHAQMKVTKLQIDKIFLTHEEIESIREVELPEHLDRIRDTFLFACYTGLRHSDLFRLSKSNIVEYKGNTLISFVPQKTDSFYSKSRKKIEIVLIPEAIEIIEKYKETHYKALPVISNQKMNEALKTIGEKAGINDKVEVFTYKNNQSVSEEIEKYKLITCHSARHTFATQSLSRGVPIEVVQQLMGHSDIKTTQIYAKLVDEYKHQTLLNAWKKV